jgi:glutamate-1-semialdehyde 2,1-aminomutase
MAKRTATERRLLEKAARYLPGASLGNIFQKPEDAFFIARGKGSRVWDISGNEYIDWLLGSGPALVGHAHPEVNKAVMEALEEGTTFFHTNERAVLLAEEICKAVPCAEQVRFYSSGT